jgi:hypothetical protein
MDLSRGLGDVYKRQSHYFMGLDGPLMAIKFKF